MRPNLAPWSLPHEPTRRSLRVDAVLLVRRLRQARAAELERAHHGVHHRALGDLAELREQALAQAAPHDEAVDHREEHDDVERHHGEEREVLVLRRDEREDDEHERDWEEELAEVPARVDVLAHVALDRALVTWGQVALVARLHGLVLAVAHLALLLPRGLRGGAAVVRHEGSLVRGLGDLALGRRPTLAGALDLGRLLDGVGGGGRRGGLVAGEHPTSVVEARECLACRPRAPDASPGRARRWAVAVTDPRRAGPEAPGVVRCWS